MAGKTNILKAGAKGGARVTKAGKGVSSLYGNPMKPKGQKVKTYIAGGKKPPK